MVHRERRSARVLRAGWVLFVLLILLGTSADIFAWGGPTHSALAGILFDDPTISPFLSEFGIDAGSIESFTGEPPDAWHHPGWEALTSRGYLGSYGTQNWASLDETTRLKYLIHNATDCGVPLGHSPAGQSGYKDTVAEAALELQVSSWGSYPSITGTTSYTHSKTGYSTSFTGTYSEIVSKFQAAVLNNAAWLDGRSKPFPYISYSQDDNRTAGWNGTTLAQYFGRAMLADYFLAKRDTVANIVGNYGVNPGQNAAFSSAGSNDPDSITWLSNGTYTNDGGGITSIAWDLNNDGVYETSGAAPTLSYDTLYSLVGPNEGKAIRLQVTDNEGKTAYATSTLAVYTAPVALGKAQYGWLGKAGDVPSQWDWDNLLDDGSSDADGSAIVEFRWDIDNNGTTDLSGASARVTYDDLQARGITANENHKVTLTVVDNEGVASSKQVSCPVLVNPTCNTASNYAARGGSGATGFAASGNDADGGGITQWLWDINGDGVFGEVTGQNIHLTAEQLVALGAMMGRKNVIGLKAVDNDADITGGWAGSATASSILAMYGSFDGDVNSNGVANIDDLRILAEYFDMDITGHSNWWAVGDFNLDGWVNSLDYSLMASRYSGDIAADWDAIHVPEPVAMSVLTLLGAVALRRRLLAMH